MLHRFELMEEERNEQGSRRVLSFSEKISRMIVSWPSTQASNSGNSMILSKCGTEVCSLITLGSILIDKSPGSSRSFLISPPPTTPRHRHNWSPTQIPANELLDRETHTRMHKALLPYQVVQIYALLSGRHTSRQSRLMLISASERGRISIARVYEEISINCML